MARLSKLLKPLRDEGQLLKLLILNEEFLVSINHQLVLIMSLPFVHTARRSYRLNDPVIDLDCCSVQLAWCCHGIFHKPYHLEAGPRGHVLLDLLLFSSFLKKTRCARARARVPKYLFLGHFLGPSPRTPVEGQGPRGQPGLPKLLPNNCCQHSAQETK